MSMNIYNCCSTGTIAVLLVQLLPDKSCLLSAHNELISVLVKCCTAALLRFCTAKLQLLSHKKASVQAHASHSGARRSSAKPFSFATSRRAIGSAFHPKSGSGSARTLLGWNLKDIFAYLCHEHFLVWNFMDHVLLLENITAHVLREPRPQ